MQLVAESQVVQFMGQSVQVVAPASEKVPVAQSSQEPLTDFCWARHCSQIPLVLMPKPSSQDWQAVSEVQAVQLLGQLAQVASPGAAKVPITHFSQEVALTGIS